MDSGWVCTAGLNCSMVIRVQAVTFGGQRSQNIVKRKSVRTFCYHNFFPLLKQWRIRKFILHCHVDWTTCHNIHWRCQFIQKSVQFIFYFTCNTSCKVAKFRDTIFDFNETFNSQQWSPCYFLFSPFKLKCQNQI